MPGIGGRACWLRENGSSGDRAVRREEVVDGDPARGVQRQAELLRRGPQVATMASSTGNAHRGQGLEVRQPSRGAVRVGDGVVSQAQALRLAALDAARLP